MTKTVTGRINRRGTFITPDGRSAQASFGREWRNSVDNRKRVRIGISLDDKRYAGIVFTDQPLITLSRQFEGPSK